MSRLEIEHANILAALDCFIERQDAGSGWRIAGRLWLFWWMHNHLHEADQRYQRLLSQSSDGVPDEILARGLLGAGITAEWLDRPDAATQLQEEALRLWSAVPFDLRADEFWSHVCLSNVALRRGDYESAMQHDSNAEKLAHAYRDDLMLAMSVVKRGLTSHTSGDLATTERLFRTGLAHARRSGDPWATALLLGNLTGVLIERDDLAEVGAYLDELSTLNRAMAHQYQLIQTMTLRSELRMRQGRTQEALEDLQEGIALARRFGHRYTETVFLDEAGEIYRQLNRLDEALGAYQEALRLAREQGTPEICAGVFEGIGRLMHTWRRSREAIRMIAAANAIRDTYDFPLGGAKLETIQTLLAALRSDVSESEFAAEWAAGTRMSMDDAIAYALEPR